MSEIGAQGEISYLPDQHEGLMWDSFEKRKNALHKRIAYSQQRPFHESDATDINGNSVPPYKDIKGRPNSSFRPTDQYEFLTKVAKRTLPPESTEVARAWIEKVLKASALQSPEYRDAPLSREFAVSRNKDTDTLTAEAVFFRDARSFFQRGESEWYITTHRNSFDIVSKTEDLYEVGKKGIHGNIEYYRSEKLGEDSEAVLLERDTAEALAGIEDLLKRFREAGSLNEVPKDALKNKEAVWKRVMKTPAFMTGSVNAALVAGGTYFHRPDSVVEQVGLGVFSALSGYKMWKGTKDQLNWNIKDMDDIIRVGEFEWKSPLNLEL